VDKGAGAADEPVETVQTAAAAGGTAQRTSLAGCAVKGLQAFQHAVLPMAALAYSLRDNPSSLYIAAGLGLFIALVSAGVSYLGWRRLTYTAGLTDIRVESGIISRAARSVPFERIQDVSVEQSLIPRLFGLVEIRFETGAGGQDELKLAYLPPAEGARLRELVRSRKNVSGAVLGASSGASSGPNVDSNADDEAPQPDQIGEGGTALFAMDTPRLLTFGLFEFSLAVVAVIAGTLQQFGEFLQIDFKSMAEWPEHFAKPIAALLKMGPLAQILGVAAVLAMLALVGFGAGLVRTILRDWGFLLERTARGFRRRRGLLTRTDVVMPVHRVQAVRVGTGLIRRRFGWHGLSFVSLAQDSGAANHSVAPFGQLDEINPIIREAGFDPPAETLDWQRGEKNYRIDGALAAALLAVPATIILLATGQFWFAFLPFGAAGMQALRGAYLWRFERNALSATQLFIHSGWLAPQLAIASRVKLQSAEISQHFLGRWRGYVSLRLGLAGGTMTLRGINPARAHALRSAILASIAETDFSRLGQIQDQTGAH